jgi:dTDP-4-amino-4,6-dideoxygalactose transaminase
MLTAISRYGPRVIPNTMQIIGDLKKRGQFVEGPHLEEFEQAFAARLGPGVYAASASYGRMAFFYILQAMDFPRGSEVVFPALTFWVIPEIARVLGLEPVFADVDPVSFNMTADSIERVLTPRTVAVVPTHLWGLPCDMREILALAAKKRIRVIEDCAHALGALYQGEPVGTLGDAALFSFQTIKPLNAYGGGMAVCRDPELARRIARLSAAEPPPTLEHVKQRLWHGRVQRIATRPPIFTWTLFPIVYVSTRLRFDFDGYFWEAIRPLEPLPVDYRERMSNVQAAIGLEALSHLSAWTDTTERHARRMSERLSEVPGVRVPVVPADRTHAFYQYCAYVPDRDAVVDRCLRHGIDLETLHVDICSDLPLFGASRAVMPGAAATTATVQIPIYESLTDAQLDRVAEVTRRAVLSQTEVPTAAMRAS